MTEFPISDETRTEVWQCLWDAARSVRYYQIMHERYLRLNQVSLGLLAALGTSAVATLWGLFPPLAQALAGVAIAVTSVWVIFAEYAAKSAAALAVAKECDGLSVELRDLFFETDNPKGDLTEPEVRQALASLTHRLNAATQASGFAKIGTNDKVNRQSADEAADDLVNSYA